MTFTVHGRRESLNSILRRRRPSKEVREDAHGEELDAGCARLLLDGPARPRTPARSESATRRTCPILTQAKTREYVGSLLAADGAAQQVRITGPLLVRRISALRESLDGAAVLRRVKAMQAELEPAERRNIAGEIDKLRDVLTSIARQIRGR